MMVVADPTTETETMGTSKARRSCEANSADVGDLGKTVPVTFLYGTFSSPASKFHQSLSICARSNPSSIAAI
jgi:hypothetical protein